MWELIEPLRMYTILILAFFFDSKLFFFFLHFRMESFERREIVLSFKKVCVYVSEKATSNILILKAISIASKKSIF